MKDKEKGKLLIKLFLTTLYISAFTFGGGFVIVTLMKKKFVDEYGWLSDEEMLDITAMSESCPGPIAVNAAVLVGWKLAGFLGMLVAVLGTIIPPLVVISVISFFYNAFASNKYVALLLKGMQAGVAAVILDVVLSLGKKVLKSRSWVDITTMIIAFAIAFFTNINVIFIILAATLLGVLREIISHRRSENDLS